MIIPSSHPAAPSDIYDHYLAGNASWQDVVAYYQAQMPRCAAHDTPTMLLYNGEPYCSACLPAFTENRMSINPTWAKVIRGMATSLDQTYRAGLTPPEEAAAEATRLIDHERGCPDDVRELLERIRDDAQRHSTSPNA